MTVSFSVTMAEAFSVRPVSVIFHWGESSRMMEAVRGVNATLNKIGCVDLQLRQKVEPYHPD